MKKYFILGLGISGRALVKVLIASGAQVYVYDHNLDEQKIAFLESLNIDEANWITESEIPDTKLDLIIKSPGLKPTHPIIQEAEKRDIPVISDIEMGYLLEPRGKLIAITGTNGKTTTTKLVDFILSNANKSSQAVGNIGVGLVEALWQDKQEDYHVIELSSYQLAHIQSFRPHVAAITNITPDHLDWHGSFEKYRDDKLKIAKNMDKGDFLILNYDDPTLKDAHFQGVELQYFSVLAPLTNGYILDQDVLYYVKDGKRTRIMERKEIPIPGLHNVENILCAIAITHSLGLSFQEIQSGVMKFKAVEHRIEPCGEIAGVKFYNDSKGTNPEATIKAIKAMDGPILLITGGYDKGSDFKEMLQEGKASIKALSTMGETGDKISQNALELGFKENQLIGVKSLEEAILKLMGLAEPGDNILLSPACASWGMYPNYEARGNHFKRIVSSLKDEFNEEEDGKKQ